MQHQVGITLQEARQRRHHEHPRQGALHVDPQQALGRGVQEGTVRFLQVGQQAHAAPVIGLAVMGQPHLARGAFQQARAQALFHALDQIGDGGPRNPQILGRLGETAPLGDADEHLHFLETVHARALLLIQMKLC